MPYKEKTLDKVYYSIGELAARYKCYTSQIRFYCAEFNINPRRRSHKGFRLFRQSQIETLDRIFYLIEVVKMSLKGAKQWLEDNKNLPYLSPEVLDPRGQFYQELIPISNY